MPHDNTPSPARAGFSLVELSIVLVILGLLVGGVLAGRQLVNAAELRAQLEQLKTYQTGVNTFRLRFGGLPGDVDDARQLFSTTEWPDIKNGNGNERINDADGDYAEFTGEIAQFWMQLSAAKLIEGTYSDEPEVGDGFPETAIGRNGLIALYDARVFQQNIFYLGIASDEELTGADSLTAAEAAQIDEKIDDGHPLFGNVRARNSGSDYNDSPNYYSAQAPLASPLPVFAELLLEALVSSAHATSVSEEGDACLAMASSGSTAEKEQGAYYLQANSRPLCQLSVKME